MADGGGFREWVEGNSLGGKKGGQAWYWEGWGEKKGEGGMVILQRVGVAGNVG